MSNETPMEQAPAASVEERVGRAFSNFMGYDKPKEQKAAPVQQREPDPEQSNEPTEAAPETDSGDNTDAPTAEEFFEFETNGKKYQIPKELESNFLQQKDYTQKTQAIAEQRKTWETLAEQARVANMQAEFHKEIGQELQQLQAFDAVLSNQRQIDWSTMTTDEIVKHKIQLDSWKEQRDAIKAQLDAKYREFTGKRDEAIKALRQKANETAASRIPGWNDATQKAVRDHALSEGYTEGELEQAGLDPRHWVTLWKAQQFDAAKARATKTVSDVKSVKTTPSNPMPQAVKDKLAFNKQMQKANSYYEKQALVKDRVGSLFAKR